MDSVAGATPHLFTVGHSNHSMDEFIALLKKHEIQVLADVRSSPYSAYVTHFAREELEASLKQTGIKYLFLGKELGGRPDAPGRGDIPSSKLASVFSNPRHQRGIAARPRFQGNNTHLPGQRCPQRGAQRAVQRHHRRSWHQLRT